MGYKEVMALRQEGDLEQAVALAREDYKASPDQWSSSALFWVLKDIVTQRIEAKEMEEAGALVTEMEGLVHLMGATAPMAEESLANLRQSVVPHFAELEELVRGYQQEKNRYRSRDMVRAAFAKVAGWFTPKEQPDRALHPKTAQLIVDFFDCRNKYITLEEARRTLEIYLSLELVKPSELNSRILRQALFLKELFREQFDFTDFLCRWDPAQSLRPEDWQRSTKKGAKGEAKSSLVDRALSTSLEELIDRQEEVPPMIYELFAGLQSLYPDDRLVKLTQARLHLMEGKKDAALEEYIRVLSVYTAPHIWAELAMLLEDRPDLQAAAYAKTLKDETDDYRSYLPELRVRYAGLLIEKEEYGKALRELRIAAQISGERRRELPAAHAEMMTRIPEGTEEDKENKVHYVQDAKPAEAYVYSALAAIPMMVMDVIALRLKEPVRQMVPMLKLCSAEGRVVLTNPVEMGLPEGDLRGKLFEVKFIEPEDSHAVVVQMEPSERKPRELFPIGVSYITGYSREMHSFHLVDTESRHHLLPGEETDYMIGEFVDYILLFDTVRKPTPKHPAVQRALLIDVRRAEPVEALAAFPLVRAYVTEATEGRVVVETESGVSGTFSESLAPIRLSEGDECTLRGFVFTKRDRFTDETRSYFVTLSVEPLPTDQL